MAYTGNIVAGIGLVSSCTELNEELAKANQEFQKLQDKITAQLAKLEPLMVAPTDLSSVISWTEKVIQTYILPHTNLIQQQADLTTKLAQITSAASQKASDLGC